MNKPTWTDVWYDRHVRSWCIQVKDDEGNSIDSTYVYSKAEATIIDERNMEYYKIDPKYSKQKRKEYQQHIKTL